MELLAAHYPNGEFNGLYAGGRKIKAVSTVLVGCSANNYWDENGNFKAGSTGSYIQWDGTTFAIKGDIRGRRGLVFLVWRAREKGAMVVFRYRLANLKRVMWALGQVCSILMVVL